MSTSSLSTDGTSGKGSGRFGTAMFGTAWGTLLSGGTTLSAKPLSGSSQVISYTILSSWELTMAGPESGASFRLGRFCAACLKGYLQHLMFWDVLTWYTFDANLIYIFNLSRVHNIKNCVIRTALVALDSIGAFKFNPCSIL